ncbi:MAG: DUF4145 domain-containing protein [Planctomycetes bacterium]|nr:DUF4145 domain-containing protein [Planctomycetota bacterium]
MKCPHCLESYHDFYEVILVGNDTNGNWGIISRKCPSCDRIILALGNGKITSVGGRHSFEFIKEERLIYPRSQSRVPLSKDIPEEFAQEYREACSILADSSRASAAISRRCLFRLLREKAHVKSSNLANAIQEVIDSGNLPPYLAETINDVKKISNFAAHPIKSERTGEVVDIEPGEADWNLDVLESLFNFYFVQPAIIRKKREILNLKLKETDRKGTKKPNA